MEKEIEMRGRLEEMELLRAQGEAMQQQLLLIEKTMEELVKTKEALAQIKELRGGEEMLFPLGSGIYGKGTLSSKNDVFVNLGAEIVCSKSVKEAEAIIETQAGKMDSARKHVGEGLVKLDGDLSRMKNDIQKLVKG